MKKVRIISEKGNLDLKQQCDVWKKRLNGRCEAIQKLNSEIGHECFDNLENSYEACIKSKNVELARKWLDPEDKHIKSFVNNMYKQARKK
jgi:hypothetical protein